MNLDEIRRILHTIARRWQNPQENPMSIREMTSRYIQKKIYQWKYRRPPIPVPFAFANERADFQPRLAVILHCYYVELIDEMLLHINQIPFAYQLHVSTDTEEKRAKILSACDAHRITGVDVRMVPNRGRDTLPKYVTFRDVYDRCDYFLQLHSKKSPHHGSFGKKWCHQLLETLIGSPEIIRSNLRLLADHRLGLVFPVTLIESVPRFRWSGNFEISSRLALRMGIEIHPEYCPDYPEGGMFWGKPAAIKPILDLNLRLEDFPKEAGQLDGEIMHALERLVVFSAQSQGLSGCRVEVAAAESAAMPRNDTELAAVVSAYLAGQESERIRYDKRNWKFRRRNAC